MSLINCLDPHLNKSLADHGVLADVAEEALVVPGQSFKRHKLGAAKPTLAWFELGFNIQLDQIKKVLHVKK